jgi:hypothetical protein
MTNGAEVPPATPAPPGAGADADRSRAWLYVLLAVLAVAGAAVGFYFVGRSSADTAGARAKGKREGEALYAKNSPRYRAIYQAAFAAGRKEGIGTGRLQGRRQGAETGRKLGLDQGKAIGQLQGERKGIVSGATAALGGFTDWQPGSFYVVKFANGKLGVPFAVDSRKLMASNLRYAICANNPGDVCTEPVGG